MDNQVYKKKGRRYVKIGYSDGWMGFPTDGIWVVQTKTGHKSSECMMRIGEIRDLRPTLDLLVNHADDILKYMIDSDNVSVVNVSYLEFVQGMLKEIGKKIK